VWLLGRGALDPRWRCSHLTLLSRADDASPRREGRGDGRSSLGG
jgi:hypothetical protein